LSEWEMSESNPWTFRMRDVFRLCIKFRRAKRLGST
jgi:hypothetical protein